MINILMISSAWFWHHNCFVSRRNVK